MPERSPLKLPLSHSGAPTVVFFDRFKYTYTLDSLGHRMVNSIRAIQTQEHMKEKANRRFTGRIKAHNGHHIYEGRQSAMYMPSTKHMLGKDIEEPQAFTWQIYGLYVSGN